METLSLRTAECLTCTLEDSLSGLIIVVAPYAACCWHDAQQGTSAVLKGISAGYLSFCQAGWLGYKRDYHWKAETYHFCDISSELHGIIYAALLH